jgi:hypothetical protein
MPIWVLRMTDFAACTGMSQAVHKVCTVRAPMLHTLVMLGVFWASASAAQVGTAWEMFVHRCLDPFEHQTLPVVDGLRAQPVDQMHEARRVFGPTPEGFVLVLDAAPKVGERACIVEVATEEITQAEVAWRHTQLSEGRYTPDGDWLVSHEWIEPRVMVRSEASPSRTFYTVVETDLES